MISIWKKRKGKTSKFVDALTSGTREKGIKSLDWIDKEEQRRKIEVK